MTEKDIDLISKEIVKSIVATQFVETVPIYCEKFQSNESFQSRETKLFIHNFMRYNRRTFYYARNLLNKLSQYFDAGYVSNLIKTLKRFGYPYDEEDRFIPIDDEIFFDYDAFIFSSKSAFDKRLTKGVSLLYNRSYEIFRPLIDDYSKKFVKPILDRIRNEIVHLNLMGSSYSSHAQVSRDNGSVEFRIMSTFYSKDDSEVLDLLKLFMVIFENVKNYFWQVSAIILHHYFSIIGLPIRNVGIESNNCVVRLSDFEIPEYSIPK